jgi:hypothetical protein
MLFSWPELDLHFALMDTRMLLLWWPSVLCAMLLVYSRYYHYVQEPCLVAIHPISAFDLGSVVIYISLLLNSSGEETLSFCFMQMLNL